MNNKKKSSIDKILKLKFFLYIKDAIKPEKLTVLFSE